MQGVYSCEDVRFPQGTVLSHAVKEVGVQVITNKHTCMAKKLYVGGLPYATTDTELKEAFSKAGTVASATIIMDKMTGRSKGFGFVEFASDEEAAAAIEMMNGKDFGGRSLTVNEARPLEERPRRDFRGGGGNDRGGYGGGNGGGGYGGNRGGGGGGRW